MSIMGFQMADECLLSEGIAPESRQYSYRRDMASKKSTLHKIALDKNASEVVGLAFTPQGNKNSRQREPI